MIKTRVTAVLVTGLAGIASSAGAQTCPQTSANVTHAGATLDGFATTSMGGMVYNGTNNELVLQTQAGLVSGPNAFDPTYHPEAGCAADFDEDGWVDFVGSFAEGSYVLFYKNETFLNEPPVPNWNDPMYATAPKFTFKTSADYAAYYELYGLPARATGDGGAAFACGDFNTDGHQDFMVIRADASGTVHRADMVLGNGAGFAPAGFNGYHGYEAVAPVFFPAMKVDSVPAVIDINGDGFLDIVFGGTNAAGTAGVAKAFLNGGGPAPTFTPQGTTCEDIDPLARPMLCDIPVGASGAAALAMLDLNNDGFADLAAGGPAASEIALYYGLSGGGYDTTIRVIDDPTWTGAGSGGAQVLIGGDFDLDGQNDLAAATTNNGGTVYYWKDHGAPTYLEHDSDLTSTAPFSDANLGFGINYDNDPASTIDFVLGDYSEGPCCSLAGDDTVFANRLYAQYVACGEVASDILDLGPLTGLEMVVTAARLDPTSVVPGSGSSLTWYMSNEDPPNWQLASPCPDDATQFCVAFAKPTGRTVRWRAVACSDTSTHVQSPTISQVDVKFDYTTADTHYRAGVVVDSGMAFVGAFKQPGEAGHFYATSAALDDKYWDAAERIDAMSDSARNIYTSTIDGATRLDFTVANATSVDLQAVLGVASDAAAAEVIDWQRSPRFGVGGVSRLGAVLTSAPAVLTPPPRPYFYNLLSPVEKTRFDTFATGFLSRPRVVFFGSKDGAIHAMAVDLATPDAGGTELWAFIPPRIANGFVADKAASKSDNYPDGSPTLADVKIGTQYRTVALIGSGNGGKSVMALDVTDSATTGPIPLWDYVPGGADAGQALSKPAVIRVKKGAQDRFLAVMATGVDYLNMSAPYVKGLDVEAVDIATGVRAWRFRAECPISTNIVAFESDDDLEPGNPVIDGYIDRVVFADLCGNVYKLNPGVDLPGNAVDEGWNVGYGAATGALDPAGQTVNALFSVASSSMGEDRPIAGTIGSRTDDSGRVALFFGTGGTENFDVTKANAFFSVYADDGSLRDQITGLCNGPSGSCEKFYGGIVVTPEQVLATRAIDPPIATSSCDLGSAQIVAFELSDLSVASTLYTASTAMVSSLYGDAGALYATTLGGQVVRVGTPANPTPTTGGGGPPPPPSTGAVKRRTWRELLF